jgi:hypothetical protein
MRFVGAPLLGRPTAELAQDTPFTAASLDGDYGFVGTYAGDVARLVGTAHFDGKGNLASGMVLSGTCNSSWRGV